MGNMGQIMKMLPGEAGGWGCLGHGWVGGVPCGSEGEVPLSRSLLLPGSEGQHRSSSALEPPATCPLQSLGSLEMPGDPPGAPLAPGMNKITEKQIAAVEKQYKVYESMIQSMTEQERAQPELLIKSPSRRRGWIMGWAGGVWSERMEGRVGRRQVRRWLTRLGPAPAHQVALT